MDVSKAVAELVDHIIPKLDTYEVAIYLYLIRKSRLVGIDEVTIGFKSARRKLALGIGEKGKPMSEATCYSKLTSLEAKGCIKKVLTTREGTRVRVFLPDEIPGAIPETNLEQIAGGIESEDFFTEARNRERIFAREDGVCFYCRAALQKGGWVVEHVVSRPAGSNGYRNVVAACRSCNNQKNNNPAREYLNQLRRGHRLSESEFDEANARLDQLLEGKLVPPIPD